MLTSVHIHFDLLCDNRRSNNFAGPQLAFVRLGQYIWTMAAWVPSALGLPHLLSVPQWLAADATGMGALHGRTRLSGRRRLLPHGLGGAAQPWKFHGFRADIPSELSFFWGHSLDKLTNMNHINQNWGKSGRQHLRKMTENMSGLLSQCEISLLFDGFQLSNQYLVWIWKANGFFSTNVIRTNGFSSWPNVKFRQVVTHLEQAGFEAPMVFLLGTWIHQHDKLLRFLILWKFGIAYFQTNPHVKWLQIGSSTAGIHSFAPTVLVFRPPSCALPNGIADVSRGSRISIPIGQCPRLSCNDLRGENSVASWPTLDGAKPWFRWIIQKWGKCRYARMVLHSDPYQRVSNLTLKKPKTLKVRDDLWNHSPDSSRVEFGKGTQPLFSRLAPFPDIAWASAKLIHARKKP